MKRRCLLPVSLVIALGFGFFSFCSRPPVRNDRLAVVASIVPLADFSRQVGGDRVKVTTLVPAGASPHTFELTPQMMAITSKARLVVLNGVGLEYWADKLVDNLPADSVIVLETTTGMEIIADDDHASGNPHVWLNPRMAAQQVRMIGAALKSLSPADSAYFNQNEKHYLSRLDSLDLEIRTAAEKWAHRSLICVHPAWEYFTREYNLELTQVIIKNPGSEPSPKDFRDVVRAIRRVQARAIFNEPQFSPTLVNMIAAETGVQILTLDPLGSGDYIATMRENLSNLNQALQ
ncbi:zinc ABC transporter substrate-binding protein [candidate division KSB1 bacterium]|nr:zinc ABC transporter substrate-binding protein [candidate division KSB1 bacterium]